MRELTSGRGVSATLNTPTNLPLMPTQQTVHPASSHPPTSNSAVEGSQPIRAACQAGHVRAPRSVLVVTRLVVTDQIQSQCFQTYCQLIKYFGY